jgi:hypothetical protein
LHEGKVFKDDYSNAFEKEKKWDIPANNPANMQIRGPNIIFLYDHLIPGPY